MANVGVSFSIPIYELHRFEININKKKLRKSKVITHLIRKYNEAIDKEQREMMELKNSQSETRKCECGAVYTKTFDKNEKCPNCQGEKFKLL